MTDWGTERSEEKMRIPKQVAVLPLRDIVVYPYIIVPLSVSRDRSIQAINHALSENRMILLLSQKDGSHEEPAQEDLFEVGTVAVVMRMLKLPDGRLRVLVQGVCRARVDEFVASKPFLRARITRIVEPKSKSPALEQEALMRNVKRSLEKASSLGKPLSSEVMVIANNLEDPGRLADLAASNLELKVAEAQIILRTLDPMERLRKVNEQLNTELDLLTMQQEINSQAREEIDRSQREFFLRQQLKAIQSELGEGNELTEEVDQFREKAHKARMPKKVKEEVERQISRLEGMHPDSAETAALRNYLDWMVTLPWSAQSRDNMDLKKAQVILDEDHFGLEPIKERILEYLAVRKLNRKMKGPILCFVGPPGVGKTSLGRSIARALGRKFVRVSLGGIRDEAEIRGHRRTYVGSMPGRIIQGLHQAETNNPVFMLDEVDKLGNDYRGDPASAMLEVLDPEQNNSFRDHYLGIPFDLSNVMFIATANLLDPIHPAFRDRMEVITLAGYMEEEKIEICKRHLLPKQIAESGLKPDQITFGEKSLRTIITRYTREAGLRNMEREIAKVCRKVARRVAEGDDRPVKLNPQNLEKFLGVPRQNQEASLKKNRIGVATGLAWTAVGGEILFVEATVMKGKGRLILTGHLGTVMKESAQAALSFARSRAAEFGLEEDIFSYLDIHVHVPEGAIPKDGPSAGITMAVALVSALTNRPVRRSVAMTGEITLRGNVLGIGGLREKALAALRAKIHKIVIPESNRKNIQEIPKDFQEQMEFLPVSEMHEVLEATLEPVRSKRKGILGKTDPREGADRKTYAVF